MRYGRRRDRLARLVGRWVSHTTHTGIAMRRSRLAVLALVFALAAACSGPEQATGPEKAALHGGHAVPSASAAAPQTTIVEVNDTFTNDFDCPFPLEEVVSGSFKDMLFFDVNGNPVKEILTAQFQGSFTVTWTNLATGAALTSHEAAPLMVQYNPDGSFASLQNVGLLFHVSTPQGGTVLLDVGRVVIRRGQGIVFEAGPHQELNGDTGAFCAALS